MRQRLSIAGALAAALLCLHCTGNPEPDPGPTEDPGTGTDLDSDSPPEALPFDPCLDGDQCDDPATDPGAGGAGGGGGAGGAPAAPNGYVVGARLLVKTYTGLHKSADASSALVSGIAPDGGVKSDGVHLWGSPAGIITPAQVVKLANATKKNGFYEVTFDGKTGWVPSSKLVLIDEAMDPVDFALQPALRNAFFKHQIHRTRWNKDGPSHSGNCAPTSLAMALRIFGKEPAGLSVEESIHRVRLSYSTPVHDDNGPTSRLQIAQAAAKLGLEVHPLGSGNVTAAQALTRLEGELSKKRVVVLEGETGNGTSTPSLYQKAMNKAYAAAIAAGQTLYHNTYTFGGYHSILVLGRDASGHFIVGDPFSEVGFVALTSAEMKDYMTRWVGQRGTGNAVYSN